MPAMQQFTANTTDYELRLAREELVGWVGALDAKRPTAWKQYGYPDAVTFEQLLVAYERGGPAHGAVQRLLDRCWLRVPRIKQPTADKETPAETKLATMLTKAGVWRKLREFDRRNMIGRYAGLIYRVADGKALSEPLQRAGRLVDLVPLYENQLKVTRWDTDNTSPNYGQPAMWQYRTIPMKPGVDLQGMPEEWADVHPSRLQLLAEGSVSSFFDGVPLLRAGFNHLIDLEKIGGGSAESFLKNSARVVVLKFDANASPQAITSNADGTPSGKTVAQAVEEKITKLNKSIDASIVTQGGDATTLQTTISDPTGSWMLAANLFAASVQIPFTILFGQQTGRLASDEDKADFISRCVSRQANALTPAIEEFITRMQAAGIIETAEWEVEWQPLDAPGDAEKADLLGKMTAAMKQAFDAGLTEPLFDANELRAVLDYEQRTDDGMPEEGEEPLDVADPAATHQPQQKTGQRAAPVTPLPRKLA